MVQHIKFPLNEFTFTVTSTDKPIRNFFYIHRKYRLYVPNWTFFQWFAYPEEEFSGSVISAVAEHYGTPISTCIINVKTTYEHLKPIIGFFTRKVYRRNNLTKILGELAYEEYKNLGFDLPIYAQGMRYTRHWGDAHSICQKLTIPSQVLYL